MDEFITRNKGPTSKKTIYETKNFQAVPSTSRAPKERKIDEKQEENGILKTQGDGVLLDNSNKTEKDVLGLRGDSDSTDDENMNTDEARKQVGDKPKTTKLQKKKYFNKFSARWLTDTDFMGWLEKSKNKLDGHELAHCRMCNLNITAHKHDILRHKQSDRHMRISREIKTNTQITEATFQGTGELQKRAEIKLAGFLAEKNLPISTMDDLGDLFSDIFPDSKIAKNMSIHRTKATAIIKNSLSDQFSKELSSNVIAPGQFFSIILDETTDIGCIKQCAFVIIFCDAKTNEVKTRFLDMKEVPSSTANDLVECLKESLKENNILLENLVGYSSDTTNVMFGEFHSVVSLLKVDLPQGVFIKCSCHLIHLVASKACMKLPRSIEDLLRNLGSHFSRSFGRQKKLQEFQEFFSVELHKILSLSTTRWLSVKQVVDRVLEQYTAIQAYLRETVFDDPSKTTEEMLSVMDNKYTELYLEFMSYALGLFVSFNLIFQSETPLLHKVKPEVEDLMKKLANNYLTKDSIKGKNIFSIDHKDQKNFVEDEELYLGMKAHETLQNLMNNPAVAKNELKFSLGVCRNFYIEAITQLKIKFDLKDPIFDIVRVVDPLIAQKSEGCYKSLIPVFKRFPVLEKCVNVSDAEQDWRDHSALDHNSLALDANLPAEKYWKKVFSLTDSVGCLKFPNLKKVIQLLLVLPFSNASVERVFSTLKNIKTFNRNRLATDTLKALMITKEGIEEKGGSKRFQPTTAMLNAKIWK